jgi:hypothetical protein
MKTMDANQVYTHSLLEKEEESSIKAGRLGRAFHNLYDDRETLFILRFKLKGPAAGCGASQLRCHPRHYQRKLSITSAIVTTK